MKPAKPQFVIEVEPGLYFIKGAERTRYTSRIRRAMGGRVVWSSTSQLYVRAIDCVREARKFLAAAKAGKVVVKR